jgi:hypothetical protein
MWTAVAALVVQSGGTVLLRVWSRLSALVIAWHNLGDIVELACPTRLGTSVHLDCTAMLLGRCLHVYAVPLVDSGRWLVQLHRRALARAQHHQGPIVRLG